MKSLIVSCCKYREHDLEFVRPLIYLFPNSIFKKYFQKLDFEDYEIIILSGTALKDFDYLNYLENFYDLLNVKVPVIGICAGCQILSRLFDLKTEKVKLIGKQKLSSGDYGYFLTSELITKTPSYFENIEYWKDYIVYAKYDNFHLFSYHPEVLNTNRLLNIIKK